MLTNAVILLRLKILIMRLFYTLTACVLLNFQVSAQKYKIKKDIVFKNGVEIAKINGKLKSGEASIEDLQGNSLLHIKINKYDKTIPGAKPVSWFSFNFPQFEKEFSIALKATYFSTKQILKHELHKKGVHFYEDGIHEEELAALEDDSKKIKEDTSKIVKSIEYYKNHLTKKISRPLEEVKFFKVENSSNSYWITQGYRTNSKEEKTPITIGKFIAYENKGKSLSDPSKARYVTIYKKLPRTVDFKGAQTDILPAAHIDLEEIFPKLYLYQTGKSLSDGEYNVKKAEKNIKIAQDAARFLVSQGYL